jgi:hypothetical protein
MNVHNLNKAQLIELVKDLKVALDEKGEVVENVEAKSEDFKMEASSIFEQDGKLHLVTIKYDPLSLQAVVLPDKITYDKNMSHMATFEMKKRNTLSSYKNVVNE